MIGPNTIYADVEIKPIGKLPDYIKVNTAPDGLFLETRSTDVMGISITTHYMKREAAINMAKAILKTLDVGEYV